MPNAHSAQPSMVFSNRLNVAIHAWVFPFFAAMLPMCAANDEVITQIKKYAVAVAGDERFRDVPTRWSFSHLKRYGSICKN